MTGYRNISGGVSSTNDPFTETFALKIGVVDTNIVPTDAATFAIALAAADTNAAQSEAIKLGIPAADTNATPTDGKTISLLVWLSGGAGGVNVTSPAAVNGQNDGLSSSQATIALGSLTSQLTATLGGNVPAGMTVTDVVLRVWFTAATTLITSNVNLKLVSLTALFSDVTAYTLTAVGGSANHSTGTFTFDVDAAGINTLAKIQSIQFQGNTSDAVAGVTPATLTIDAAHLIITGAFA